MSLSSPDQGLSRSQRLIRPAQFEKVYGQGRKAVGRHLILWALPAEVNSGIRLGVVASRRVGGSVQRNRARRLLREAFRRRRSEMKSGADVVIVARRSLVEASFREADEDLLEAARRAGLLPARPRKEGGS
ncbi:MAG: ribonuclease P protein component [Kiritimatiellia bacterium]|nr:ribonuclease P protein component [Kiritimatiellia bacterium]